MILLVFDKSILPQIKIYSNKIYDETNLLHNEINLICQIAEKPYIKTLFRHRKSTMVLYQNYRANMVEVRRLRLATSLLPCISSDNQSAIAKLGFLGRHLSNSGPPRLRRQLAVPEILCSLFASQNFDRCAKITLAASDTVGARVPCPKLAHCQQIPDRKQKIPSCSSGLFLVEVRRLRLATSLLPCISSDNQSAIASSASWVVTYRTPFSSPLKRKNHTCVWFSFGRSAETRTPGLQYPKLARYQLRYTSIHLYVGFCT